MEKLDFDLNESNQQLTRLNQNSIFSLFKQPDFETQISSSHPLTNLGTSHTWLAHKSTLRTYNKSDLHPSALQANGDCWTHLAQVCCR